MAYLPLDKVDDAWHIIQSNAPDYEKLVEYIDYFVENRPSPPLFLMKCGIVTKKKHRTNNIVEGWNH